MLSFLGKMAVRIIVAFDAFCWQMSMIAFRPRAISATVCSSRGCVPTLFVPASRTMTLGRTPSSSPCSSRHRMFSVRSAPQPKFAAFHPKKFARQLASSSGYVERAPASDDRIAFEIHVDPALLRFLEQLRVRSHGVLIGPRRRPVG
jgi:hypothetical protein